jgi:hypothetical protein
MNVRTALIWLLVMTCVIGAMAYFFLREGGSDIGPRYTPEAFKRQWNINAPNPALRLDRMEKGDDGYFADFGDGLNLVLHMRDDVVTGVRVRYEAGPAQGAGGPRFLQLMRTALTVGMFRWPQERVEQAHRLFSFMTPARKTYRYRHSSFACAFTQGEGWDFSLDFVPNDERENTP